MKLNCDGYDEARHNLLKNQNNGTIIFDMSTVTGIQLLTEDFLLINTDVDNIDYIEVVNPVTAWPDREPSPITEKDYEVASAKIIIKNIKNGLFDPRDHTKSAEGRERAYQRLMSRNIYGIAVEVADSWKTYYFSPDFWQKDENNDNIYINPRVKIELNGDGATIIALDEDREE